MYSIFTKIPSATRLFFSVVMLALLTACHAPQKQTTVPQTPTKVKAHTTSYIYFSSIPKNERTVYIALQNDSSLEDGAAIETAIKKSFQQKAFTVVDNLDKANVAVRINLLRFGEVTRSAGMMLLESEFGNSTPLLVTSSDATDPENVALVLDVQYFERKKRVDPEQVATRHAMTNLSDIQLLLLCNTTRWQRFQTRIAAVIFYSNEPLQQKINLLANAAANANMDIIRGVS